MPQFVSSTALWKENRKIFCLDSATIQDHVNTLTIFVKRHAMLSFAMCGVKKTVIVTFGSMQNRKFRFDTFLKNVLEYFC